MKNFLLTLILIISVFFNFSMIVLPVGAQTEPVVTKLDNPLGTNVEFSQIAGTVIRGLMGIIGSLTLLMFVWGGFQWLTSAGNAEKVEAGSKTMIWAVIGVLLVFSSYFLISTFTTFLHTGA